VRRVVRRIPPEFQLSNSGRSVATPKWQEARAPGSDRLSSRLNWLNWVVRRRGAKLCKGFSYLNAQRFSFEDARAEVGGHAELRCCCALV